MPRFRYKAVNYSGVPVHGTADVADDSALIELLRRRGQTLESFSELSLESLLEPNDGALPRLHQLRVGEQIREAMLTGLPAHDAVRAMAAEPMSHPVLDLMPWVQVTAVMVCGVVAALYLFTQQYATALATVGVLTAIVVPLMSFSLRRVYGTQPRAMLHRLADRLEAGESLPMGLERSVPADLRPVMRANMDDERKIRVLAELIPTLPATHLQGQQFALCMIGPFVLLGCIVIGFHFSFLWVVPRFIAIFEDFGTDLPYLTQMVIHFSDIAVALGPIGLICVAIAVIAGLATLLYFLNNGVLGQWLERIPVFGLAFRWAMQARVARMLAAMIRCNCSFAVALRTATAASGFKRVKQEGEALALGIETGALQSVSSNSRLSGLPISLLLAQGSGQTTDDRRVAVANAFENLAGTLGAVGRGQGMLFTFACQFLVIVTAGIATGVATIAMFLPLIKLLNDLS